MLRKTSNGKYNSDQHLTEETILIYIFFGCFFNYRCLACIFWDIAPVIDMYLLRFLCEFFVKTPQKF